MSLLIIKGYKSTSAPPVLLLPIYLEYQNTPPLPPLNLKQLECITTPSPSAHYLPRPVKSSSDNRDQHTCRVKSPIKTFSYKRWPLGFGSFGNIWIEYIQIYPNPHMRINISEIQLRQKSSTHLSCNIPRSDALRPHPLRVLVVQTHL